MNDSQLVLTQSKMAFASRSATILAEKYQLALHNGSENYLLQFGSPFLIAALETLRGVVEPSIRRRNLRAAMNRSGVEVPLSSLKPGAILLVGLAVILEHSGVYLGDGEIAELHGSGEISQISIEQFRVGRDRDKMKMRSGDRIYVASLLSKNGKFEPLCDNEAAETARKFVGNNVAYNLLVNNCHLFTANCVNHSKQLVAAEQISTIEDLENCIARANSIDAYEIFWFPVGIPTVNDRFEKKIRSTLLNI